MSTEINSGTDDADDTLANVFGPQHQHVVALIGRAFLLTENELRKIDQVAFQDETDPAFAYAVHSEMVFAAECAGCVQIGRMSAAAAREAAFVATQRVAENIWDDLWVSAQDSAQDAGWALATRHLIGRYGLTQAHYDFATSQWASVIGPVHPADEDPF